MEFSHQARYLSDPVPLYYDEFRPAREVGPPLVLVHGGAFTGSCYLTTPDGRPGWAHDFVRHGRRVIVPDWPGIGRSGGIRVDDITGGVVVEGLGALLRHLATPVVLLVHSMAGPYGFRLVETHGELIQTLVAVAPGPPGNIQQVPQVLRESDTEVEIATPAAKVSAPKTGSWRPPAAFARDKFIGASERFSPEFFPALLAATVPVPAKVLLGRLNYRSQQLAVSRPDGFAGKRILVLTGSYDPDHPREVDQATVDWLRGLGAEVDYHFLTEHGIAGNGHMLMSEENSREIADHIAAWLA